MVVVSQDQTLPAKMASIDVALTTLSHVSLEGAKSPVKTLKSMRVPTRLVPHGDAAIQ